MTPMSNEERLLADLAAFDPMEPPGCGCCSSGGHYCVFCREENCSELSSHDPECIWRRAKEQT